MEFEPSLPGPYKIDPVSNSAFRIESEGPGGVIITDMFGGRETQILRSEWETWEDAPITN